MKIIKYKCDRCGKEIPSPIKIFPEEIAADGDFYVTNPEDPLLIPIRSKDFCRECVRVILAPVADVLAKEVVYDMDTELSDLVETD